MTIDSCSECGTLLALGSCGHYHCPLCAPPAHPPFHDRAFADRIEASPEQVVEGLIKHFSTWQIERRTVIMFEVPEVVAMDTAEILCRNLQSALRVEHPDWNGLIMAVPADIASVKVLGWLAELSDDSIRSVIEVLGRKIRELEHPGRLYANLTD